MTFVFIFCLLSQQVQGVGFWWEKSKAFSLNTKNFDKYVGQDKYVFLEFYSKSCIYCEKFMPDLNRLVDEFNGPNGSRPDILIAKINGEENDQIAENYNVHLFPTFVLLFPGNDSFPHKFVFERDYKTVKKYLEAIPKFGGSKGQDTSRDSEALKKSVEEVFDDN